MWISVFSAAPMGTAISGGGAAILSVSQLLRSARDLLEQRFPLQWIGGEVSNLRPAASGHLYFTLKDQTAQVDCVMFRSRAAALGWELAEGQSVEARALVTLYEPRGRFQLTVESMRRAGLGPLYERFLKLKDKLEREGVFDPAAKRPLPEQPRQIGVITSLAAAALRDVLTTLARRNPCIPVVVYPAPVQGEGAAAKIARAIATASERAECDVLLLVRGGGSIEDLWQFNEESVARAIRASKIPVVVGVGHETDFTIADFAADERAPTPTAAAELVSTPRAALLARLGELGSQLSKETSRKLQYATQALDALTRRLTHPAERLRASSQLLGQLGKRLSTAMASRLKQLTQDVKQLNASLTGLSPLAVLGRGYSLTADASGNILRDAENVPEGERITTTLAKGKLESEVLKKIR
jgi:exodeoxyribonuclease VII large subunit